MLYFHHQGVAQVLAGLEALGTVQETRLAIELASRLNAKDRDELLMSLSDALMLRDASSRQVCADLVRALREKGNA
jgi:hypothetical protein